MHSGFKGRIPQKQLHPRQQMHHDQQQQQQRLYRISSSTVPEASSVDVPPQLPIQALASTFSPYNPHPSSLRDRFHK